MPPTTPDPATDPLIGSRLDSYQIEGILGRGGYSVVYRARQVTLDREVALKVLTTKETGVIEEQVEAFLHEARVGAKLNHPCLLQIYDVIEAEGRHGMAMELVSGGDLAKRIRRDGPLPWQQAVPILRDIARALQFAHASGYTHRDVKPANILLTDQSGAKLADLGLTDSTSHAGTAAFMAPEQILRRKTGKRTDLYALGCTGFAMLTGRAPFAGLGSKEMLRAHVKQSPPWVSDLDVELPVELENLIDQMLEKQPADRPASAEAVLTALEAIDTAAPPIKLRSHRAKRSRQRSSPAGSMILSLVVILIVVAGAMYAWRQLR